MFPIEGWADFHMKKNHSWQEILYGPAGGHHRTVMQVPTPWKAVMPAQQPMQNTSKGFFFFCNFLL